MPVKLYRRHSRKCLEDLAGLRLPARAVRNYMDCECPIWAYGRTETQQVPRQSVGTTDLKTARAKLAAVLKHDQAEAVHGPKLEDCIEKYLTARKNEITESSRDSYAIMFGHLRKFVGANGVVHIRELTVDLCEEFKSAGLAGMKDSSIKHYTGRFRKFLSDAFRRGWLLEDLAAKVLPHHCEDEAAEPFTEDEVKRILEQANKPAIKRIGYTKYPETFRLLLELMLETGMRVSDAIEFDPGALQKGQYLWIYRFTPKKQRKNRTKKTIEAYISDRLKTAIDNAQWFTPARPFRYPTSRRMRTYGNEVYKIMLAIGKRCGVPDCRPHRLRDTFATRKLLAGVPLEDVSRLLGHSSIRTTETYYAKWTSARTRLLEERVFKTL